MCCMQELIRTGNYHQMSICVASLRTTFGRCVFLVLSSLNLLKYRTGQCYPRALLEFSQFLISGMDERRCLRAISLTYFPTYSLKTEDSRFSSSQITKSITVKQPQYHPSSGHSCSQSRRMGSILLTQQKLKLFFSQCEREGLAEQMSPRTAPLRSCLLLMLSIFTRSASVRPKRSVLPARSIRQLIIPVGPVTTKSLSRRKGRSRTIQSLASASLNLFH